MFDWKRWAGSSFSVLFRFKFAFPLLAFFVPLIVRAIPEVLMYPYLTGFDTVAHYVPTSLLWMSGGVDCWSFLATAPLFYSLVVSLVSGGGSLVLVLKVLPPLLHGFLGLSVFGFAKRGLGWGSVKSLVVAVFGTLYFVALRVSWDMLRTELALVLLFVVLMLFSARVGLVSGWKRCVLLSVGMVLVVLSEQMVAAVMFGIFALTVLYDLFRGRRLEAGWLVGVAVPAVVVFLVMFLFSPSVPEYRLIFGFSQSDGWLALFGFSSYWALFVSTVGFFVFCFLPVVVFVVLGFRRVGNLQLYLWVLLCGVLAVVPMVSPSNLRWVMLLVYPFAFLVVEGLVRLRGVCWRRVGVGLYKVGAVYLVVMLCVLSGGLVFLTTQAPLPYFGSGVNGYVYQMPSSLLQNTVSLADCSGVADAMVWVDGHMGAGDALLSHRAFYGWAVSVLNRSQVVLYEYDNPLDAAENVSEGMHGVLYLVWWVNGQGWYGQSSVPSMFHEVHQSGNIAVYEYFPAD